MANDLTESIQRTIKDQVPVSKPCMHSKSWWNSELREMKKKLNRLSRETMRSQNSNPDPQRPMSTQGKPTCAQVANLSGGGVSKGVAE